MCVGITRYCAAYVGKLYTPHSFVHYANVHFTKVCLLENRHESSLKTMILCIAEYRISLNILTTNLHIHKWERRRRRKSYVNFPSYNVEDPTSIWQPQYICIHTWKTRNNTHPAHCWFPTYTHTHDSHNLWVESYPWRYAKLSFHKHLRNTVPTFPLLCTFFYKIYFYYHRTDATWTTFGITWESVSSTRNVCNVYIYVNDCIYIRKRDVISVILHDCVLPTCPYICTLYRNYRRRACNVSVR